MGIHVPSFRLYRVNSLRYRTRKELRTAGDSSACIFIELFHRISEISIGGGRPWRNGFILPVNASYFFLLFPREIFHKRIRLNFRMPLRGYSDRDTRSRAATFIGWRFAKNRRTEFPARVRLERGHQRDKSGWSNRLSDMSCEKPWQQNGKCLKYIIICETQRWSIDESIYKSSKN